MNPIFSRKNHPSRRQFLVKTGCSAMGITSVVNTLAHLRLMQGALNAQSGGGDYKAIVCIFLNGGNDSNNMLIPTSGEARSDYEAGRGVLAIPLNNANAALNVLPLNATHLAECDPLGGYLGGLGVHPKLSAVKTLFDNGDAAFIANVGTLTQPGVTRANYSSVSKPPQLYSHSDQQVQWQSSVPDKPFTSGWGGRIADLLNASYNPSGQVSMSVSISGVNSFQTHHTGSVQPYVMTGSGLVSFAGYGTNYASAVNNTQLLFEPSNYKTAETGQRLQAFEEIMQMTHANLLDDAYNSVHLNSRLTEGVVGAALQTTAVSGGSSLDTYFNNAFAGSGLSANNDFTNQMKLVARLIAGRAAAGNSRQIFFVQHGGYDTHNSQIPSGSDTGGHTGLMNNLNCTLKGFADAIKGPEVGNQWNNLLAFTMSDFTRTFTPNKTGDTAGTDHAWGGHALVLGGAVKGGRVYGKFPVLKRGSVTYSIDATGSRGLWIPSTPVDQYAAAIARWFGVESSALGTIFPNLSRFVTLPTITSGNMDFLES